MEFELDPPHGVGPLRLGMTSDEARAALETLGPLAPTAYGELLVHLPSGLTISVGFGVGPTRDRVNAIEIWRPHERDVVRYHGIDLFGLPTREVVQRLRKHIVLVPHEYGEGFIARETYLALGGSHAADDDPDETTQDHFFQSVLMARPGYDDTPAEAAARQAAGGLPGY